MPLPIWIIPWPSEAQLPLCSPAAQAERLSLHSQGGAGCSRAQSVSGIPVCFPPLQGRMPARFLRGSITALWDPTRILCEGFRLHKVSSKNHDTKQIQNLSQACSLSRAQCPRKSNPQATLTAMQSPGRLKNRQVKGTCSHSCHCRCVLPPQHRKDDKVQHCLSAAWNWACFRNQEKKRNQINFRSQSYWPLGITCYNQTNLQGLQPSFACCFPRLAASDLRRQWKVETSLGSVQLPSSE